MITQKKLKEALHYNPDTGVFTWRKSGSGRKSDLVAGSINSKGYARITLDGATYYTHHLAILYVFGYTPEMVDHKNRNRSDNAITNLRYADHEINNKNKGKQSNNKSGVTGVTWHTRTGKWMAGIKHNKKSYNLGYFDKIEDAIKARQVAELKFGFHPNHGK